MTDTTVVDPPQTVAPNAVSEAEQASREIDVRQREAVEQAADLAMAMPGNASYQEFLSLCVQARVLSMSAAAPKAIRGNPHVALHVVMIGRDLGISASAAVELIDVIETKQGPRPSLSPQLLNGQIRRLGLGSIVPAVQTAERCVAVALGPGGQLDFRCKPTWPIHHDDCACHGIIGETEFTWEDAQMAGLAGRNCKPGDHKKSSDGKCPCNFGYINYPKRMLWWRGSGFCADDWYPEAGLGLYSAEELGSFVDAHGRAIDAASVELPAGFEPPTNGRDSDQIEMTDEQIAERWTLQERVYSLPEDAKATFRERWKGMQRLRPHRLSELPADCLNLVASVLRGLEQQTKTATKGEWDPDVALAATREQEAAVIAGLFCPFAVSPQDAPPAIDDTNPAPEAAATGDEPTAPDATQIEQPSLIIPPLADSAVMESAGEEQTKITIALVKAMSLAKVDNLLGEHKQSIDGNPDTRRARLTMVLLRETVAGRK